MTLKDFIAMIDTSRLEPSCGDPAYTFYRGQMFSGKLMLLYDDDGKGIPFQIVWDKPVPNQPHTKNCIDVGADDSSCQFDKSRMAWHVIANYD